MSVFWKVATLFVHINVSFIWIVTSSTAPPTCTQHAHSSLRPCPQRTEPHPSCLPRPWREPILCLVSTPGGSGGWAAACRPAERLHFAEHHSQCRELMKGHMTDMWQMKLNNWNWKIELIISLGLYLQRSMTHGPLHCAARCYIYIIYTVTVTRLDLDSIEHVCVSADQ